MRKVVGLRVCGKSDGWGEWRGFVVEYRGFPSLELEIWLRDRICVGFCGILDFPLPLSFFVLHSTICFQCHSHSHSNHPTIPIFHIPFLLLLPLLLLLPHLLLPLFPPSFLLLSIPSPLPTPTPTPKMNIRIRPNNPLFNLAFESRVAHACSRRFEISGLAYGCKINL